MKNVNRTIINTVLTSDQSITDHQRESALAILDGDTPPLTPLLIRQTDVANLLSVSRQTVWTMTKRGTLTPVRLSNGLCRYKRDEIEAIANGEKAVRA